MSEITLKNVSKIYENQQYAVRNVNLEIQDKEFVILVGPSGCGKSTTLRMIAGLEEISDGELYIDGEFSNYCEPKDREMSMVFQNYALYPNMTVYGNLAYALKIRKVPKDEIKKRVHEVALSTCWIESPVHFQGDRNREWQWEAQLSENQKYF